MTSRESRAAVSLAASLIVLAAASAALAEDKEVTLSGDIGCASCIFHVASECATAIRVKEASHDVIYLVEEKPGSQHRDDICENVIPGKVTGVLSVRDGKKYIKARKIEYSKPAG